MAYDFRRAIAEILPVHMPEYIQARDADGEYRFAVPGHDVTSRDYLVRAAEGTAPLSADLNLRSINSSPPTLSFSFHLAQYLTRRGDSTVIDWTSLNANSKYYSDRRAVAMRNWENARNIVSEGITRRVKMRDVMRLVLLNVLHRNDLDVLVNPTITVPPVRIGYAGEPRVENRPTGRFPTSANLGIPEITVPAGFNRIVYDPEYVAERGQGRLRQRHGQPAYGARRRAAGRHLVLGGARRRAARLARRIGLRGGNEASPAAAGLRSCRSMMPARDMLTINISAGSLMLNVNIRWRHHGFRWHQPMCSRAPSISSS